MCLGNIHQNWHECVPKQCCQIRASLSLNYQNSSFNNHICSVCFSTGGTFNIVIVTSRTVVTI